MEQAINIREAKAEELDEVEDLVKTAYREFQPLMPAAAWDRWMDNISETIHSPLGLLLVLDHRGKIEGAVAASSAGIPKKELTLQIGVCLNIASVGSNHVAKSLQIPLQNNILMVVWRLNSQAPNCSQRPHTPPGVSREFP